MHAIAQSSNLLVKQFGKSLEQQMPCSSFSEDQWIRIKLNLSLMLFWKQNPEAHPFTSLLAEGLPLNIVVIDAKEIFQT